MKAAVIIALALAVLGVLAPLAILAGDPLPGAGPEDGGYAGDRDNDRRPGSDAGTEPDAGKAQEPDTPDITVDVLLDGSVVTMQLEEYLVGVVAAEMPASFEPEALKAQAVAARTYTLHRMLVSPSPNHPEADVCGDAACCKAYSSVEALREKWGAAGEENLAKMEQAVGATRGEYMSYGGEPILAVFHAASAGRTETSGVVWGRDMPYLLSVESPETEEAVKNYVTEVRVSHAEFKETVMGEHPEADLSGAPSSWIGGVTYTPSGRVASVVAGGVSIKGTEMRALFGLRSAHMDIDVTDSEVVFTVTGSGHGVGMSQYGANALAQQGYTYREILAWYYAGVVFADLADD